MQLCIPQEKLPVGTIFNSFEDYWVQELEVKRKVTKYQRARYRLPSGEYLLAPLPEHVSGHFGNNLKTFITNQYHHNNVTQNKIHQDLAHYGIQISEGTIDAILDDATNKLEPEYVGILEAGKTSAQELRVDDTGGKHNDIKHYHLVIQNNLFTYIKSCLSKSRKSFLQALQGERCDYVINEYAIEYLRKHKIKPGLLSIVIENMDKEFSSHHEWIQFLEATDITAITTGKNTLLALEEAALLGGLVKQGVSSDLIILSDGAPQFKKIFLHALCWIHAERGIKRLIPASDNERTEIKRIIDQIWDFYDLLKKFKANPVTQDALSLIKQFDEIFSQDVESEQLFSALCDFRKNKNSLLRVLDYPFIDLHNNSSESAIRPVVCKRKISGPTRGKIGYKARDIFTSIIKTCLKLGISPLHFISNKISGNTDLILKSTILAKARLDGPVIIAS